MSNEVEKTSIEETAERVERLAKMVEEIDDDFVGLSAKLNRQTLEYQDQLNQHVNTELLKLRREIEATLQEMHVRFVEKVQERIRETTAEEIAAALATKQILVVRPATREEAKSALAVRQATPSEIRNQNQS